MSSDLHVYVRAHTHTHIPVLTQMCIICVCVYPHHTHACMYTHTNTKNEGRKKEYMPKEKKNVNQFYRENWDQCEGNDHWDSAGWFWSG